MIWLSIAPPNTKFAVTGVESSRPEWNNYDLAQNASKISASTPTSNGTWTKFM